MDDLSRGQVVHRWALSSLPVQMRGELERIATRRGYRHAAHLLSDPPARCTPPIPLAKVAHHHIKHAKRLRRALRPWFNGASCR